MNSNESTNFTSLTFNLIHSLNLGYLSVQAHHPAKAKKGPTRSIPINFKPAPAAIKEAEKKGA